MRAFWLAAFAALTLQPGSALAASYLYSFSGIVTYANNADATAIYANEGDPIAFALLIKDTLATVSYAYGSRRSSATGGPDHALGTLFPVDRTVTIDPTLGWSSDFTPLRVRFSGLDNYSASVTKDLAAGSLVIDMAFLQSIAPEPGCQERCSGTSITHSASAQVYTTAFALPDFRETGSFDLLPGSIGTLADGYSTYLHFGDAYEVALSKLTVTRLPDAVPETATWAMMIVGLGLAGAARRRQKTLATLRTA